MGRKVNKSTQSLSPHLSPDAERGLLTPFPFREGGRGLGLRDFGVNNNTFRHPL